MGCSLDTLNNPSVSGECICKDKYIGRTCGQCKDGFGNVRAGCRQCDCNPDGATGEGCHPDTGKLGLTSGIVNTKLKLDGNN